MMPPVRRWKIATASLATLLAVSAIYIGVLQRRVERATAYAFAGMQSVQYVCGATADALETPYSRFPPILRVAEACTDTHEERNDSLLEVRAQDFGALSVRIRRLISDGKLPLWGAEQPPSVDTRGLPRGLRDD